jgi:hypothetical protein
MADTPMEERRFTDREVREILKRAVKKTPSRALVRDEGLSLAELEAIGHEVGIDPARLEDAARAVSLEKSERSGSVLGGPTVMDFERRVEGEFYPTDTPDILAVIRRTMGQQGEVAEVHGSLEWQAKGESGERYVTLSSRDGATTIRSSANLSNLAILTYLPAGAMGLITSMVGLIKFVQDGSQIGLIVCLAVLPILYPILRTIMGKVTSSESTKLQKVVDELARMVGGES